MLNVNKFQNVYGSTVIAKLTLPETKRWWYKDYI